MVSEWCNWVEQYEEQHVLPDLEYGVCEMTLVYGTD